MAARDTPDAGLQRVLAENVELISTTESFN